MTDKTEKGTLITLDFSGTKKTFTNADELREFMRVQESAWSWLERAAREDDNLNQVWDPFAMYFRRAERFIVWNDMSMKSPRMITLRVNSFKRQTQDAVNKGFILAETPSAKFVLDLKDRKSALVAGYALAHINNIEVGGDSHSVHLGRSWAKLYLSDSKAYSPEVPQESLSVKTEHLIGEVKNCQIQIRLLIKEAEVQRIKHTSDFKKQITEQAESFENIKANQAGTFKSQITEQIEMFRSKMSMHNEGFKSQIEEQASNFESRTVGQKSRFEILIKEVEKKFTALEISFSETIALRSSVRYWVERREHHQIVMWWMAVVTAVFAGLTGTIFYFVADKYLDVTINEVKLVKIGVMLLISTLGIWLTRISAKIFISNLHLRTDADERVTMIQTYLALLAEDKIPKDDERKLILQTLFRHSTIGIIKDEGPVTFPETFAKNVSPK